MKGNKLNPKDMGLVLSLDRIIEMTLRTLEQCSFKIKYARTPRSKEVAKQSKEYLESVLYHLNRLKKHEQAS